MVHYLPPRAGFEAPPLDAGSNGDTWTTDPGAVTCETCRAHLPAEQLPSDPWPQATWPEGAVPSVDQLREWLHTFNPGVHDARPAAGMILGMLADAQRAAEALRVDSWQLEQRFNRYRLAWLSARARATREREWRRAAGREIAKLVRPEA